MTNFDNLISEYLENVVYSDMANSIDVIDIEAFMGMCEQKFKVTSNFTYLQGSEYDVVSVSDLLGYMWSKR